ncbi:MAG TPA: cell division protein FtsZ [Nitrospinota bacterium]|jgi:cell division protein FtsZ|nr:cell division protein FtsZ [Nitrospinota bacterium]HJN02020.1 cell division protein FtsZ [Nitrospinota bacterium]
MIELAKENTSGANIKVIGVGGGGSNAIGTMIASRMKGVEFIVANTDIQALQAVPTPSKLQLGVNLTKGLGAGSDPEMGRQAALENSEEIGGMFEDADMVFVTAGMGGGTGTGAAPVIAQLAKEKGALTVGVVTKPFHFEGKKRMSQAEMGLMELRSSVDTLITIPNQRLLGVVGRHAGIGDAFKTADNVLKQAVKGISDLILTPGLINLDFADVKTIMSVGGMAIMGSGSAEGDDRAIEAAQNAISSPLLEDTSIEGAKGVLINITGGQDMSLFEIDEASTLIQEKAHQDAHIIFGAVVDEKMKKELRVTVIATGFEDKDAEIKNEIEKITRGLKPNVYDIPTHVRLNKNNKPKVKPVNQDFMFMDEAIDTPTFLRRAAD